MKPRIMLIVTLLIATVLPLFSQNSAPIPMDATIRYGKLSNGLTYYIRHNEQPKDRVEFYIAQKVGAILENDDQNGLAHFLEHMAFNGTQHFPGKSLINYFETIGVRFGTNINAYTSLDETVYNLSDIPTYREGIIDSALLVLHDWSSFISLHGEEIDKERGVILEEWRQGNDASRRLWKASNAVITAGSQYAKRDVIGDTAVIKNFSHETLRNYYKKWYRPDLQAILIVGDIDVDQMEARVKNVFADIPAPVSPAERSYYFIPLKGESVTGVYKDKEMQTTQVILYYLIGTQSDEIRLSEQGYLTNLKNRLLIMMTNERFEEIAREPNAPFSSLGGDIGGYTRTMDVLAFSAEPVSGKDKEARERTLKEVELLKRFGFTQSELERAKLSLMSGLETAYRDRKNTKNKSLVSEYARNFLNAESVPGIEWEYEYTKSALSGIKLEAVNTLAKEYLNSKSLFYFVYAPDKEGLVLPTEAQLKEELVTAGSLKLEPRKETRSNNTLIEKKIKPGKVKKAVSNPTLGTTEWTLSNGIKVILKPTPYKEDEIRMGAFSDGGTSLVNEKDLVSITYASRVVRQSGFGKLDQNSVDKLLTGKIVSFSSNIDTYGEGFNGLSSVKDIETLLQLVYLNFTSIRRDSNAYNRFVSSYLTSLENAALDPNTAYYDSINGISLGYHPRILLQNVETFKKIQFEPLYTLYVERFSNPADFTFEFVGNINPDTIKPLIVKYLGGLKTAKKREIWKDNNLRHVKGPLYREIDKKLTVDMTTCYVHYLINQPYNLDNNLLVTTLANILRLRYTATIREEEGGSYGVSVSGSSAYQPIHLATLAIMFSTDPKKYTRMLGIVHEQIKQIAEQGPTEEDLSKVKLNLLKQYTESKQDNAWWLQAMTSYYKNNMDVVNGYEKRVEAIDAKAVQALAKRFYEENNVREILLVPEKKQE